MDREENVVAKGEQITIPPYCSHECAESSCPPGGIRGPSTVEAIRLSRPLLSETSNFGFTHIVERNFGAIGKTGTDK
jgi:hypothetical protein